MADKGIPRTPSHCSLWLGGILLCASLLAGCAAQQFQSRSFSLKHIDSRLFLLPPETRYPLGAYKSVSVPAISAGLRSQRGDATQCSIQGSLFALHPQDRHPNHWTADLPSPAAWEEVGDDKVRSEYETFVARVSEFERGGCVSQDETKPLVPFLAESMNVPVAETLYYRYSYRPGEGIVDLVPGMRLQIQRAEFRDPAGDEVLANYRGARTYFFEVGRQRRNELAFKLTQLEVTGEAAQPTAEDLADMSLPDQTRGARIARLYLLTLYVPKGRKRAAIIVGANQSQQLLEATAAIQNDPYIDCGKIAALGASCVAFEGPVTVSPELAVEVNGRKTFVGFSAKVGDLVPRVGSAPASDVLNALTVERFFRGKYYPVDFDRHDPAILKIPLAAGDKITWKDTSKPRPDP